VIGTELTGVALAAAAAGLLQIAGFARIAAAILGGGASPNHCSWLIWSIVATLAAASSWQAGATGPLVGAVMNAAGCVAILGLSLCFGAAGVATIDAACLTLAGLGLAAWTLTADPVLGLLLFLGADACGAVPTMRGVLVDPTRESMAGWSILSLAGLAAVLSVEPQQWALSWSGFGCWGAAVYVALVNLAILGSILAARAILGTPALPAPEALE
jgi:hypothetical protein